MKKSLWNFAMQVGNSEVSEVLSLIDEALLIYDKMKNPPTWLGLLANGNPDDPELLETVCREIDLAMDEGVEQWRR
ncbi:MAG: hypothetical protein M0R06_01385 [Sphaerochaeta sp.]|jgi:hypothetical protein|nr:hypothetical protein [Sphaerochaeta sp.]